MMPRGHEGEIGLAASMTNKKQSGVSYQAELGVPKQFFAVISHEPNLLLHEFAVPGKRFRPQFPLGEIIRGGQLLPSPVA
jgi:hypothetical protein